MRGVGIADFDDIDNISNGDLEVWKKHINKLLSMQIIDNAKKIIRQNREFLTMQLFWELSEGYRHTT